MKITPRQNIDLTPETQEKLTKRHKRTIKALLALLILYFVSSWAFIPFSSKEFLHVYNYQDGLPGTLLLWQKVLCKPFLIAFLAILAFSYLLELTKEIFLRYKTNRNHISPKVRTSLNVKDTIIIAFVSLLFFSTVVWQGKIWTDAFLDLCVSETKTIAVPNEDWDTTFKTARIGYRSASSTSTHYLIHAKDAARVVHNFFPPRGPMEKYRISAPEYVRINHNRNNRSNSMQRLVLEYYPHTKMAKHVELKGE